MTLQGMVSLLQIAIWLTKSTIEKDAVLQKLKVTQYISGLSYVEAKMRGW